MGKASLVRRMRHYASRTSLRLPLLWYRHRYMKDSDVFLASYPRSGNTWLAFLVYELVTGREAGFEDVSRIVPSVARSSEAWEVLPGKGRFLRTHELPRRKYQKSIYLVRDVRDVVVSEFEFHRFLGLYDQDLNSFLQLFLKGRVNGFGGWRDHVQSWLNVRKHDPSRCLWLKYEEMKMDPVRELGRIAKYLQLDISAEAISRAVENNTVSRMQKKEEAADTLAVFGDTRSGQRFIRKGEVGGWRSRLSSVQVQQLNQYAGEMLASLGYPVSSSLEQVADGPRSN